MLIPIEPKIESYYSCLIGFANLSPEQRLRVLYDYLEYAYRNRHLTIREIKENYRKITGLSEYKIDFIERTLDFIEPSLFRKRAVGFPAKWYYRFHTTAITIIERGRIIRSDYINSPAFIVKRIERPARRAEEELEEIGVDTVTGLMIYYSDSTKKYYLIENGKIVKEFDELAVIVTYSVDTGGGHQKLVVEITSWTFVKSMNRTQINGVEIELEEFVKDALSYYFNLGIMEVAIKGGIEYASKSITINLEEGQTVSLEKVSYPNKRIFIEYFHRRGGKTKRISKTETEFLREKELYPDREHMSKGGRPQKQKTMREF